MFAQSATRNDLLHGAFVDVHTHSLDMCRRSRQRQHTHIQDVIGIQDVVGIVDTTQLFDDEKPSDCLISLGIHPWNATQQLWYERSTDIADRALYPAVVAIGETGLDALRGTTLDEQVLVFQNHIALSEQVQKPMIIHCVRAFQELIALRKQAQPRQAWIIHGFSKSKELAQQLLDVGCVLSLGADAFREQTRLQDMIRYIPSGTFVAETDIATDISVREVYERIAQIRGEPVSVVQSSIQRAIEYVFFTRKISEKE
jgi:TatD DNase family protein